jgi:hypothetical protein
MTAMLQFYDKVGFFENLVPISSMIGALNGNHHCGIITAGSPQVPAANQPKILLFHQACW